MNKKRNGNPNTSYGILHKYTAHKFRKPCDIHKVEFFKVIYYKRNGLSD